MRIQVINDFNIHSASIVIQEVDPKIKEEKLIQTNDFEYLEK